MCVPDHVLVKPLLQQINTLKPAKCAVRAGKERAEEEGKELGGELEDNGHHTCTRNLRRFIHSRPDTLPGDERCSAVEKGCERHVIEEMLFKLSPDIFTPAVTALHHYHTLMVEAAPVTACPYKGRVSGHTPIPEVRSIAISRRRSADQGNSGRHPALSSITQHKSTGTDRSGTPFWISPHHPAKNTYQQNQVTLDNLPFSPPPFSPFTYRGIRQQEVRSLFDAFGNGGGGARVG